MRVGLADPKASVNLAGSVSSGRSGDFHPGSSATCASGQRGAILKPPPLPPPVRPPPLPPAPLFPPLPPETPPELPPLPHHWEPACGVAARASATTPRIASFIASLLFHSPTCCIQDHLGSTAC